MPEETMLAERPCALCAPFGRAIRHRPAVHRWHARHVRSVCHLCHLCAIYAIYVPSMCHLWCRPTPPVKRTSCPAFLSPQGARQDRQEVRTIRLDSEGTTGSGRARWIRVRVHQRRSMPTSAKKCRSTANLSGRRLRAAAWDTRRKIRLASG